MMSPTRKARFKRRFVGVRPWVRHSLVLMVAGLAYLCRGILYLTAEPTPGQNESLTVALDKAPMWVWGLAFCAAGAMSIISSRWPPVAEKWGYMVLTGLSSGWAATYLTGVIFEHTPASNLGGALIWALLAFMWWAVSGLVNPGQAIVIIEHEVVEEEG